MAALAICIFSSGALRSLPRGFSLGATAALSSCSSHSRVNDTSSGRERCYSDVTVAPVAGHDIGSTSQGWSEPSANPFNVSTSPSEDRRSKWSRREFLQASATYASALALVGCGGGGTSTAVNSPTGGGAALQPEAAVANQLFQLPTTMSKSGLLDTRLRVGLTTQQVGGVSYRARTYNGGVMGPVLKFQPGDTVRVLLENSLPPNPDAGPVLPANMNVPHHFNTTNLHVHGLHVSPQAPSDDVLIAVDPGTSFQYEYHIPADHTEGTYWYHAHRHGSTTTQVLNGMAGPIIITGPLDEVPEIAAAREQMIFIQDLRVKNGEALDFNTSGNAQPDLIVNGQVNPIIVMYPGEVQRWRMVNAAWFVTTQIALEGHDLNKISVDGITLPGVRPASSVVLASGNRCDVLVQAQSPGTYALRSVGYDQGFGSITTPVTLATVIVLDVSRPAMQLPSKLPQPASIDYSFPTINNTRQLTFSYSFNPTFQVFISPAVNQPPLEFDPNRIDQTMHLNTAEEWTLVNTTGDEHPFHIHVNPFLVTKRNGVALDEPVWMDTVNIPAQQGNTPGSITFRTRFTDYVGPFVLHCHLLEHEDLGMMEVVQVI